MCDYSLMNIDNRLAREGEQLITHRFKTGSMGLVSAMDLDHWEEGRHNGLWQRIKDYFLFQGEPQPVVCIPPGARLTLHEFGPCENATFTQLSPQAHRHRDALVFDNGQTLLVQLLPERQKMTLVRLSSEETAEEPLAAPLELVGS